MFTIPQVHVCPTGFLTTNSGMSEVCSHNDLPPHPPDCAKALHGPDLPQYQGFMITLQHTRLSRTPLNE